MMELASQRRGRVEGATNGVALGSRGMRWFGLFHVKPSCSKRVLQPYQRGLTPGERSPTVIGGVRTHRRPRALFRDTRISSDAPNGAQKRSPHTPSSTGLSTGLRDARCRVTACASGVQAKARQTSPPRARRTCIDNHEGDSSVIRQRSASFRGSSHSNAPPRLRHVRPFTPMWLDQRAVVRGMGPASPRTVTSSCGYAQELSTELSTGATSTRSYGGELNDWRESAPAFHVKLRVCARRAVERLSSVGAIQASVHGRYLPQRCDPTLGER